MQNKKFIFDKIGTVTELNGLDKAEIMFELNDIPEIAVLIKEKYFHNGKRIRDHKHLNEYITVGTQVIFSGHLLPNNQHTWYIVMCQNHETRPERKLQLTTGFVNILGYVKEVQRRHGVLHIPSINDSMIHFLASKFYVDGKRLPSSRDLTDVLKVNDILFADAIPCIPEENKDHSKWFAILVYRGKRPDTHKCIDGNQFEIEGGKKKVLHDEIDKNVKKNTLSMKPYIYDCISRYTNDASTIFASGTGIIMSVPNEEFGIILGQFRLNQFQSILFHRKNAFLFQLCLADIDLTQIFEEGDRVKFIAVDAPSDFITDWIAIQISVQTDGIAYDVPFDNNKIAQITSPVDPFYY